MMKPAELMARAFELKDALLDVYDPEAVILFGSLGRGDADEFSDVDLLVVMETDRDTRSLGEEMIRHLDSLARDKHVIVRTPAEFCRWKDIPGTLVFSAVKEGRTLFEKAGWQGRHEPTDSYQVRKREVIRQRYIKEAHDFQARAEASLQGGSLFRARDQAKFAAARALKALFVYHDTHPPRETDLVSLLTKARGLTPGLGVHTAFLRELNAYCPGGRDAAEIRTSRRLVERTAAFIEETAGRLLSSPP
ncbi:MAG: nucleotidyltransferase domain-containing protein [Deltaproteobacteria bacterium]|nr:nucleotidyltransferase domain-containing protein [Deltaproteobacteria bacterium]